MNDDEEFAARCADVFIVLVCIDVLIVLVGIDVIVAIARGWIN